MKGRIYADSPASTIFSEYCRFALFLDLMKHFSILFFMCLPFIARTQNQVPNGDFESNIHGRVLEWKQPLDDYYHYDLWSVKTDTGVVYNAVNGLCLLQPDPSEFLLAKLSQPLVKGQKYRASMNIYYSATFAGTVKSTKTIDIFFSDTALQVWKRRMLYREPRIRMPFVTDTGSFFQPDKADFIADGTEQYIVIGKFHDMNEKFEVPFEEKKEALYREQYYTADSIKKYFLSLMPPFDPGMSKKEIKRLNDSLSLLEQLKRDSLYANAHYYKQKVNELSLQQMDTTYESKRYHVRIYFDNICVAPVWPNGECNCNKDQAQAFKAGQTYRLNNIHFDLDKTTFKPESYTDMDNLVGILKRYPRMDIQVNGHTDSLNNEKYNLDLSNRRAKAVYDYLVKKGIKPQRLKWKGYGESMPLTENTTEEGRAINRRVEFTILKNN
jgi:outer membrane protein OmpA-like peptidoglycan-associated protein